nr:MAG TPA: hypothetical protein [Caudoviricetes sp.]
MNKKLKHRYYCIIFSISQNVITYTALSTIGLTNDIIL